MTDQAQRSFELIESFAGARVVCLGDVMLDRYVDGEVSRISPEAPIPVMKRSGERVMLGGAGNVARGVVALGAQCTLIGLIGDDAAGQELRALVDASDSLSADLLVDPVRPTSEKIRFVSGNQQLLRCDHEIAKAADAAQEAALLKALEAVLDDASLLILSDYAKGVLTEHVLREAIVLARTKGAKVLADPKRADVALYAGADVISPNLKEMQAFCPDADDVDAAGIAMCEAHGIGAVALTRGKDGMSLLQAGETPEHFAAQAREVYDVSGAGDTVIATLAVALAAGAGLTEAAQLANMAAGIAVSRPGTATVYRTDLKAALHHEGVLSAAGKLVSAELAESIVSHWREEGHKVGFTNGCFDLLHVGHLQSLESAKQHCDKLVVAINADASVRRLKGSERPVNTEMDRADLLGGLACVDLVVIFREDTPEAMLKRLRPDVLMKGEDYQIDSVVGAEFVQSYGGQVRLLPLKEGYSSTSLLEKQQNVS